MSMTETPHISWAVFTVTSPNGRCAPKLGTCPTFTILVDRLEHALAWCESDNWEQPIRWMVYNDAIRSAGPYAAHTNIGYVIAPVGD